MLICFALVALLVAAAGVARADLAGLDGDTLREASLADGTTVVVVWASWSPRCREIVEQVNALQNKWGNKARVVTVNFQEEPAAARAFLQGKGLKVPVYLDTDGAFSKKHAVTWLPGLIVFQGGDAPFKGRFAADADATIGRFVQ
jgi:thiol-disulfide isomerase/thioredoxin